MDPIRQWQQLQTQGNQAFRLAQWQLASEYYLHSILLIRHHLPARLVTQTAEINYDYREDSQLPAVKSADLLICLSIAIQNLAEVYAKQQRWRRCYSLLKRAISRLQQLQQWVAATDCASVVLLQECCSLRRELCRHTLSCNACLPKSQAPVLPGLVSSSIH